MAPESRPRNAPELDDKEENMNNFTPGLLTGAAEKMSDGANNEVKVQVAVEELCDDLNAMFIQNSDQQAGDSGATLPAYILELPREIVDRVFSKLSHEDRKSLRVVCTKFEEILNPLVFQRAHMSKARVDRMAFWNISSTPKLAVHIKELVWYELAEDENVFFETAGDAMPPYRGTRGRELVDWVLHDNDNFLPDLADMAAELFWLPSVPKQDDPQRDFTEARRTRILGEFFPVFYRALEALPNLNTFTSRPMPAYHVLSRPTCDYKFVAYLFQVDVRSDIQYYQRNDGLFTVLLPAMTRLRGTIKNLHWSDEAYGESSSIRRIRYRHGLSFKYLKSIDLCLSLPSNTRIDRPWARGYERTCWAMLGACLSRVRGLEEISLCFEKADPKVGIDALIGALDDCLLSEDVQLLDLKRLNLRDGPARRFHPLNILLGRFLIRQAPTLRHLSFRRWFVSHSLLHRLCASGRLQLESLKIDNSDLESGVSVPESKLLAWVNNDRPWWPLPIGECHIKSTAGADDEFMDTPGVSDWANPKFANVPEDKDFCATIMERDEDDEDDDDFEPSESDTSESDFDLDSEADPDDDFESRSQASNNVESPEHADTV